MKRKRARKSRVPPQLRRYLFRRGHGPVKRTRRRSYGKKRVSAQQLGRMRAAQRRKRNPLQAPAPASHFIFARRGGGKRLHYNGVKMTSNGKPVYFTSKVQAEVTAKNLIRKFPILRTYDVYVTDRRTKH